MKPRPAAALRHCPNCGARLIPTPKEFQRWRESADLSQHEMAARLKISRAQISHLENGRRLPSAALLESYQTFIQVEKGKLNRARELKSLRKRAKLLGFDLLDQSNGELLVNPVS
jgi:transcriptional regulator with XRE-family HTH domain